MIPPPQISPLFPYTTLFRSHFTFENVNNLLLSVRVRGHAAPSRQRGEHLIHRLAMCNGPACDARTNFNCRIFWFHLQNLTVAAAVSAAEGKKLIARMIALQS